MRRRIPWTFLLGVGVGLLLLRRSKSARKRAPGRRATRARLPHEPEVVRGPSLTPVEAGVEKAVASGFPDTVPDRSTRAVPPPSRPDSTEPARFEPVVPDAPELRDASAEPPPGEPSASGGSPVPPTVRRRR